MDEALLRTYAYATDDIEVATVEVRHPAIPAQGTGAGGVLRLASAFVPSSELSSAPFFEARLEQDAPIDAGEVVAFVRAPIEIVRPEKTSSGVPLARFRFSNVDARITKSLIEASKSEQPVAVTIRVFTEASRLGGQPEVMGGYELVDPAIAGSVEVTARAPDVINIPFHQSYYDARFPLLGL